MRRALPEASLYCAGLFGFLSADAPFPFELPEAL